MELLKITCTVDRPTPDRDEHIGLVHSDKNCKELFYTIYVRNGCNRSFGNSSVKVECLNGNTKVSSYRQENCKGEPSNTVLYEYNKCDASPQGMKWLRCNQQKFDFKTIFNLKNDATPNIFKIESIEKLLNLNKIK